MPRTFILNKDSQRLIDRVGNQLDLAKQIYIDSVRNKAKQLAREAGVDIAINLIDGNLEIKYEGKNERAQQAFAKFFEDIRTNSGQIFRNAGRGIFK